MKKTLTILPELILTLCTTNTAFALNPDSRITGMAGNLTLGYSGNTWMGDAMPAFALNSNAGK